jgi:hypothetical protein
MNCRECELALGDGRNSPEVAGHLRACEWCQQLFEELKANAEAFESMALEEMPRVGQVGRPVWPAAIALAAAAVVATFFIAIPREEKLPPVHYAVAPMKFEMPAIRPLDRRVRRAWHPPLPDGRGSVATQPLMVKMLTDDPNVVIYWQIDGDQEGNDK